MVDKFFMSQPLGVGGGFILQADWSQAGKFELVEASMTREFLRRHGAARKLSTSGSFA